jgi:anti-anti-sigma regulatory factor
MAAPKSLPLPESLTIAVVAELKAALDAHLAGKGPVVLDGGAVGRADAAGLQLLLAFARAAQARGRELKFSQASSVLRDVAARLDLSAGLGLA